jgi:hypothetical protein
MAAIRNIRHKHDELSDAHAMIIWVPRLGSGANVVGEAAGHGGQLLNKNRQASTSKQPHQHGGYFLLLQGSKSSTMNFSAPLMQ